MPFKCSVPGCRSNYNEDLRSSVFLFPKDETLRQAWIKAMPKEDFKTHKHSRVCELHFEPSQIKREASAVDPRTGRTLTAPLWIPRLKKGAVPTLFMPPAEMRPRVATRKRQKKQAVKEKPDESQLTILLQTDLGTAFQNVVETPFVIKQEPEESADEQPRIGKVLSVEELLSSSNISSLSTFPSLSLPSSSSSSSDSSSSDSSVSPSSPVSENALPIADPDSSKVASATNLSNKPAQKRKIDDAAEPDSNETNPNATEAKLCQLTQPSMPPKRNSRLHPRAGTSKKSAGHSTLPTRNGENATREIFESLVEDSENNPLFGSKTSERPGDLFDVFADFIADKLREMDWDDCAYALRAILDVVFKVGKVHHDNEVESDISSSDASSKVSDQE